MGLKELCSNIFEKFHERDKYFLVTFDASSEIKVMSRNELIEFKKSGRVISWIGLRHGTKVVNEHDRNYRIINTNLENLSPSGKSEKDK